MDDVLQRNKITLDSKNILKVLKSPSPLAIATLHQSFIKHLQIASSISETLLDLSQGLECAVKESNASRIEIMGLEDELRMATKAKTEAMEYDLIAKQILKFTSPSDSLLQMQSLQEDTSRVETEGLNVLQTIDQRRKMFVGVLATVNELKRVRQNDLEGIEEVEDGALDEDGAADMDLS